MGSTFTCCYTSVFVKSKVLSPSVGWTWVKSCPFLPWFLDCWRVKNLSRSPMSFYQLLCSPMCLEWIRKVLWLRGSKILLLQQRIPLLQQKLNKVQTPLLLSNHFSGQNWGQSRISRCKKARSWTRPLHSCNRLKSLCVMPYWSLSAPGLLTHPAGPSDL